MMDKKEQEFLKRLREIFRVEAEEHLRSLSTGLIELEKTTEPVQAAEIIETVFREAHSLKGAARSVNLKEVETICQPLESALAALKRQEIALSPGLFDLFHEAVDSLTQLVATMDAERTIVELSTLKNLSHRLAEVNQGETQPAVPGTVQEATPHVMADASQPAPKKTQRSQASAQDIQPVSAVIPAKTKPETSTPEDVLTSSLETSKPTAMRTAEITTPVTAETVRIPITKLDPLLQQAEEMIQAKLAGGQSATNLREIQEALVSWRTDWSKWKTEHPFQANELPQWVTARVDALVTRVTALSQIFEQDQRSLRHMIDDHLDAMKQVLMLPISTLVEIFPKLVRDLGRDQGKEIDLTIQGAEIEIDKRILEELKDPLIHLVRNCIDHGIEKPEARIRHGKPGRGAITLTFNAKDSRQVEILVSDDGAGIDQKKVLAVAIKSGAITAEDAGKLDVQGTLALIFESGISTSEIITDISGRGLGLAIVREKVEKLGGQVSVESRAESGTSFHLLLPLTLATFRGVLVSAREQIFVLPTAHIERVVQVEQEEIQTVESRETIRLDGQILSQVKLADVLEIPLRNNGGSGRGTSTPRAGDTHSVAILILALADKRIALQVDEVLAEQEVLVKGLGNQLRRVRNIAGATILGAGTVVPVLNISDLMSSAVRSGVTPQGPLGLENNPTQKGRILVAEDSITARMLLKNILETGGYQVTTAVDGADAFTQLRSAEFDLLVSDVDMPRMSGFELTTSVRADKKMGELPVILVTALESRQDRERGIEVGANAYIVKSSFDQSNLLEVIGRLL
jgi:two-component system chemotaxis sensor kinase CheA